MLCCLGLFVGFVIGSLLGGPWSFIIPAIGFILGFIGDTRLSRGFHKGHGGSGIGCCGSSHMRSEKTEKRAKDPVCGTEVDETTAQYRTEFHGKTYYFCSSMCESTFKENPRDMLNDYKEGVSWREAGRETATKMFKLLDNPSFLLLEKLSVAVLNFQ